MQKGSLALIPKSESFRGVPRTGTLPPSLLHILGEMQRELGYDGEPDSQPSEAHLLQLLRKVSERAGLQLSTIERDEVLSQIERSRKPFGILQELVDDPDTSDVIVTNYSSISVQQGRRNLTTDLSFPSALEYESFVERLLARSGATYSTKKPIADGMIGAFARVHAVHQCLCESGPYLTLRLNRYPSVTIQDLLQSELAPKPIFEYLSALVRAGRTILVAGEVGCGKTTLVRALAAAIPASQAILVIEDTPEIRLEHAHVRYLSTREANTDGAGRIAPAECIRAGMRMAMNRIIFGEMRDAEAAEAFIDVCASGHPGLSTLHSRNAGEAISRLELFLGRAQRGISRHVAFEQITKAVQVIVFLDLCAHTGKRRVVEVKEIGPVADGVIRQRDIFRYSSNKGSPTWSLLNKTSAHERELEHENVKLTGYADTIKF